MAFGVGPFGIGPLGVPAADLPAEDPAELSSSRKIDGTTKKFVQNTNGGYAGMSDTMQRVLLLVSFAVRNYPKFNTDESREQIVADITTALRPLTNPKNQAIELIEVSVRDDGRDGTYPLVRYRDLVSGKEQTVQPR